MNNFLQNIGNAANNVYDWAENNPYTKPVVNFMNINNAVNTARDLGTGLASKIYADPAMQAQQQAQSGALQLTKRAQTTSDPQEKQRLLNLSRQISNGPTQDFSTGYSPDIDMSTPQRAITTAMGVVGPADIMSHPITTVKAPFQIAKGGVNALKSMQGATSEDVMNYLKNVPANLKNFITDDFHNSFKMGGTKAPTASTGLSQEPSLQTKPKMITDFKAPEATNARYQSIFDVPSSVTNKMKISPEQVVNQLIDDNVVGIGSLNDLKKVTDSVTGGTGAFPEINRIILGNIQKPIDFTEAKNAAGLNPNLTNSIDETMKGARPGLINTVKRQVQGKMPTSIMGIGEDGQPLYGQSFAHAEDLLKSSQDLGDLALQYDKNAHDANGLMHNEEYQSAADAIKDVKNNIDDAIDKAVPSDFYQQMKNDPRVQAQLNRVPPKVKERFMQGAVRFKDGQTIQAPYANADKLIDLSKKRQLNAITRAARAQAQRATTNKSESLVNAILHPKQAIAEQVAKMGKKGLSPYLDQKYEDAMKGLTSGIEEAPSATMNNNPSIFNKLPYNPAVQVGALKASMPAVQQTNNGHDNNIPENNLNNNPEHTTSLPPFVNNNKMTAGIQSKQGRYSFKTPQENGFMTGQDFQKLDNNYTQEIANAQAAGNSVKATELAGEQKQLESTWSQPQYQSVISTGSTLNTAAGISNALVPVIQNAPLSLFNMNDKYSNLLSSTNKIYQNMGVYLQNLQQSTGVKFYTATSPDQLISMMDSAMNILNNKYNNSLQLYFGGNTLNAGGSTTGNVAAPSPVTSSADNSQIGVPVHYDFNFGSAGQGLPSTPPSLSQ